MNEEEREKIYRQAQEQREAHNKDWLEEWKSDYGWIFTLMWWAVEIAFVGYLLYLLFSWLGFSVTEYLLFGIFIVLIFIYFKLKS